MITPSSTDAASAQQPSCLLCALAAPVATNEPSRVYRGHLGVVSVLPGYEVPGWLVVQPLAHRSGLEQLHDDELFALAFLTRAVVQLVREILQPDRVYVVSFGENYEHFHQLVAPVPVAISQDERGPRLLLSVDRHLDLDRAFRVASAVHALLPDALRDWS